MSCFPTFFSKSHNEMHLPAVREAAAKIHRRYIVAAAAAKKRRIYPTLRHEINQGKNQKNAKKCKKNESSAFSSARSSTRGSISSTERTPGDATISLFESNEGHQMTRQREARGSSGKRCRRDRSGPGSWRFHGNGVATPHCAGAENGKADFPQDGNTASGYFDGLIHCIPCIFELDNIVY